mgnify:FL=1
MSEIILTPVGNIKPHPNNPREIKDEKFKQLVKSIQDFPEMLSLRPLVCYTDTVDSKLIIIGGNQRYAAAIELGYTELPVMTADDLSPAQRNEFLIKDNLSYGDWDKEILKDWAPESLDDWGVELPQLHFSPTYNPTPSSGSMTDEKLQHAGNDLAGAFKHERAKYEVCCPNCTEIFFIDK